MKHLRGLKPKMFGTKNLFEDWCAPLPFDRGLRRLRLQRMATAVHPPEVISYGSGHFGGSGFSRVVGEPVVVHGASRTDAGVMPKGQVACLTIADGYQLSVSLPPSTAASLKMFSSLMRLALKDFTPSCEAVTKQYSYTWAHGGRTVSFVTV